MSELAVRRLSALESTRLPAELARKAGFPGLEVWSVFVEQAGGLPVYRLAAEQGKNLEGWVSLAHVRHPVFGNYLTTAPFASYGGYAAANPAAGRALLAEANRLAGLLGAAYVLVRHEDGGESLPDGWAQLPGYATYRIQLRGPAEELLTAYSSDHRNHIRKSLRKGFSVRFGRDDVLDDAYEAIARSMHELGSPYHSRKYLRVMLERLGERLEFVVVYAPDGGLAGGGVLIHHEGTTNNLHANILRRYRPDYAGEFLYWAILEHCVEMGMQTFDLGRSLAGSGNEVFKMKWKPERLPLAYWCALQPGAALPELNQKNPKFQLAIALWKRLPRPLVRALGPSLIRGLA
ncbi:MAG: GNAT family N-acetyltransferase [Anaerolineaceae bacterium]|nr:GNAT family N-acetyltransferase [Anaerolineaceae bacterium]